MMNNSILDDFKNAWNKPNNAPAQLIIINVVVFVVMGVLMVVSNISGLPILEVVQSQFSIPPLFSDFVLKPWTLISYSFAHSLRGFGHIIWNMLFFYWFSRIILEFLGNKRVISLYVLGALAGGILYLLFYNLIPFYADQAQGISGMVGASAAVYAVVVAAAVFAPNYTFFLFFIGPVRIKYIAAFGVFASFMFSTGGNAGGNIAHLGGALMGWLFIVQLKNGTDLGAWIIGFIDWVKSFFIATPKIKVTHRSAPKKSKPRSKSSGSAKTDQEEIDAILDKISQSGYDSLTKEEKQKLFNASKK